MDDGLGTSLLVARSPRKVVTLLRGVVETQSDDKRSHGQGG